MKNSLPDEERRGVVVRYLRNLLAIGGASLLLTGQSMAVTIESLGVGVESLLGGDLTDPEDDGDEAAGPDDPSWNWVSITSSHEPAFNNGEAAFNVFDNLVGGGDDKWCCDDATEEAPVNITVEFEQPIRLTHFTVTSGNDTPGRDPFTWQIQGSMDGVNFEEIFAQDDDESLWVERLEVLQFTLDAPSLPYTYIRYEATNTPEPLHQLTEIEYFGEVGSGEDTDGDGMDDLWEEVYGLDPAVNDAEVDSDGDTLTNIAEYERRTDPMKADTDDDGLNDNVETNTGTWNGLTDTGTDPKRPDSDSDGLLDGVENPDLPYVDGNQPGTSPHVADTDEDGAVDGLEIDNGTDPTDELSVTSLQFGGGQWQTRFVWSESSTLASIEALQELLDGVTPTQLDVTVATNFVHFHDNAAPPVFIDAVTPYPGLDAFNLDRNGFGIEVIGEIFIRESGTVTFVCNSDDGFDLFIDGVSVGAAGDRGRGNTFMPVELEAGVHEIRFLHYENGGGAGVTLAIGRTLGNLTTFTEAQFELLRPFNIHEVVTTDSDADGIDDFKETFFFGDLARDGTADFDGDGLTDKAELDLRVDPSVEDTDGDGLADGAEVNTHETDPALADTDGDTLPDGVEVNDLSTNPTLKDSDADEFDDNIEVALETDPLSADSKPDAVVLVSPNSGTESLSTAADWSNGNAPAAGSDYVVIGSVASPARTAGASPTFGGDQLSLIGPGAELILGHTGTIDFNSLVLQDAELTAGGNGTVTGAVSFAGDNMINTGGGIIKLNAQLSGDGNVHYIGSSPDVLQGSIDLGGPAGAITGNTTVQATTVNALTPGTIGTGTITLIGGGLNIAYNINSNGELLIQGDGFNLAVNGDWVFRDLKAIDSEGNIIFSFVDAVGPGTYSVADLQEALQTTENVTGTGSLTLIGDTDGDSDDDNLLDSWETTHFGDLSQSGTDDTDADGLDNAGELLAGTDPNVTDTDGDGLTDGDEVNTHGANPLLADSDSDGLDDGEEVELGLDVRNSDSDGDGLTDGQEVTDGSDPLDANSPFASFDVTMPGDPLIRVDGVNDDDADAGPPPAAEPEANVINDTTAKHLNFLDLGSGFIVTPSAGPTVVTGLRIYPANDAPERDPASYVLEGSAAGPDGPFEVISEGTLDLPLDRNAAALPIESSLFHQVVHFENTASYVSYRLVFPTLRDAGAQNSMQVAEVEFLGTGGEAPPTIGGFDIERIPGGVRLHIPEGETFDIEYSLTMEADDWETIATGVTNSFDDTDAARVANPEGYYRGTQQQE